MTPADRDREVSQVRRALLRASVPWVGPGNAALRVLEKSLPALAVEDILAHAKLKGPLAELKAKVELARQAIDAAARMAVDVTEALGAVFEEIDPATRAALEAGIVRGAASIEAIQGEDLARKISGPN